MQLFDGLGEYFADCANCGDCCHAPGDLLPQQIDVLATHMGLDRVQVFRKYLIVQIFADKERDIPAFLAAPVKVTPDGKRLPHKMVDQNYMNVRHLNCIFRDQVSQNCSIHHIKPFACKFLICSKCTRANPILLNKAFFYHHWIKAQDIIMSVYPEVAEVYQRIVELISNCPDSERKRIVQERNRLSLIAYQIIQRT